MGGEYTRQFFAKQGIHEISRSFAACCPPRLTIRHTLTIPDHIYQTQPNHCICQLRGIMVFMKRSGGRNHSD